MKINILNGSSLKFKVIALSLSITVVLGAASVGVLTHIINGQERAQLDSFEAYAKGVGETLSAQYYERYFNGQVLATNPMVRLMDRYASMFPLNAFVRVYSVYDLIMVVDIKGKLVSMNSIDRAGQHIENEELFSKNYSDTPWFKAVMEGKTTDDTAKGMVGTYFEDVHVDPYSTQIYGTKKLGTSFSAMVKDDSGKPLGVLTLRANARWIEGALRERYLGLKESGFPSSNVILIKKDGTLLFEFNAERLTLKKGEEDKHDWEQVLQTNLVKLGSKAAEEVTSGKAGSAIQMSQRTKLEQVMGYAPVKSEKFTEQVGWGVMVRDNRDEVMKSLNQSRNLFYMIFAIVLLLAVVASWSFSVSLAKKLGVLAENLERGSREVASAAGEISGSSGKLSEASTEQASAIQETAASIDEVSAMVKKSADNASESQKTSQTSREAAENGQKSVEEMIHSMGEIRNSNGAIVQQVEESNRQISEIVKVIGEIGNKTKVINDIVFQTKLLSFNASVEAARAGEHGKGFAVVAEEVGNLAAMSGNAAKEISTMLDSSIQKVEGIVTETKSKLERLVNDSKECFEQGTTVANRCGEALNRIYSTVQEVDGMVGEISSASHEQSQGVIEINKAINSLDQVTQENSATAQRTATSAEQLNAQSIQLRQMVHELFSLINGNGKGKESGKAALPAKKKEKEALPENVVSFKSKKTMSAKSKVNPDQKLAVGAENQAGLPAQDDPRFEDI